MTRKHFEAIAAILKAQYEAEKERFYSFGYDEPNHLVVRTTAENMADYFETQNPLFDRRRFLIACGL